MCGISGRLNLDGRPVLASHLETLGRTLTHRGPDDWGVYLNGHVGLSSNRLSIIDLSTGHQPIRNEDGSVWVVFNGEIYNYQELRQQTEQAGHRYYTDSDTEVLVHLYEEFGQDYVQHLNGMYAIALWDEQRRQLLLSRDRVGIKPLYYYHDSQCLLFASEVKALLASGIRRELDPQALHDYLSYGYICGEQSILQGVQQVPPGHQLRVGQDGFHLDRYWHFKLSEVALSPKPMRLEEAEETLGELLRDSVRRHLISDVPIGVFLSGGVDSSAVVAIASEVADSRIRTFSIGFEERSFNELPLARQVAQRYGTEHHEWTVRPEPREILPKLAEILDEPFADSSVIPMYYVSQMARQSVKVALGGEGGDEVFGGYLTYNAEQMAELYRRLPGWVGRGVIPWAVRHLPVSHARVSLDYRAKRFVRGVSWEREVRHFAWKVIFDEAEKEQLYSKDYRGYLSEHPCQESARFVRNTYRSLEGLRPLVRNQWFDFSSYLPDNNLLRVDRLSMAHSLEARVPLLDHRIVEFVLSLPPSLRVRGFQKKYLLKHFMRDKLPPAVLGGKKKGFNVPIPSWLRGELRSTLREHLAPDILKEQGLFDPTVVQRMIEDHEQKRADYSRNLWTLLMFSLWHQRYYRPTSAVGLAGKATAG